MGIGVIDNIRFGIYNSCQIGPPFSGGNGVVTEAIRVQINTHPFLKKIDLAKCRSELKVSLAPRSVID